MPNERQPYWQVKSHDGRLDLTPSLQSVEVEDNDRLADKATIVIGNPSGFSAEAIVIGLRIVVGVGWRDESAMIFEGIVRQVSNSAADASGGTTTLVAYDMSTIMNQRAFRPNYSPGTLEDIVYSVVLNYHNLEVGKIKPDPNPEFSEPTPVPPGMSDLQFVQYLALKYRARAFVEYVEQDMQLASRFFFISEQELATTPPQGSLRCCGGFREMLSFDFQRVATSAMPFRPALVMNPQNGESATSEPATPAAPEPPAPVSTDRLAAAERAGAGERLGAASVAATTTAAGPDAMAREIRAAGLPSAPDMVTILSRADPTTVMGLRGQARVVGNIHLRAKTRVSISGITSYAEGAWYIKVAKHKVTNGNYETELTVTR